MHMIKRKKFSFVILCLNTHTKKNFEELGIKLHYIPTGFTDICCNLIIYYYHMLLSSLKEEKNLTTIDACYFMIAAC